MVAAEAYKVKIGHRCPQRAVAQIVCSALLCGAEDGGALPHYRKGQVKRCACSWPAFDFDAAVMRFNQPARCRETQACAGVFGREERLE